MFDFHVKFKHFTQLTYAQIALLTGYNMHMFGARGTIWRRQQSHLTQLASSSSSSSPTHTQTHVYVLKACFRSFTVIPMLGALETQSALYAQWCNSFTRLPADCRRLLSLRGTDTLPPGSVRSRQPAAEIAHRARMI